MTEPGSAMRRAALLVHAMRAGDRAWVLAQLEPGERDPLAAMLAELRALGIPAESELLKQAAADAAPEIDAARGTDAARAAQAASREPLAPDASAPEAMLRRADPALVARVLRTEPSALAAAVLALGAWPWRETVLAQLGAMKRTEIHELLARDTPPAARLREHALPAIARRVEALALAVAARADDGTRDSTDGGERQPRGWRRLLGRARRRTGGW